MSASHQEPDLTIEAFLLDAAPEEAAAAAGKGNQNTITP
jgi:hypothetical protein